MHKFLLSTVLVSALINPTIGNTSNLLTQADGSFGTLAVLANDDQSSSPLDLPFQINFYGNTFNRFYINNNGNITFQTPLSLFTPRNFPGASQPIIAPYWADIDTRCASCGQIYVGSPNHDTVTVTWNNVGYFSNHSDKTNNFQLVLRNRASGDFDVEFRYDRLQWTTGDSSGGVYGLGGVAAQAGWDAGDGVHFFTLPGSGSRDVLNLANTSNVVGAEPGFWSYSIRDGLPPGSVADNPLQPVIADGNYHFDFHVGDNQTIFLDPLVAVGYDYQVLNGPNVASVTLPGGIGDNQYALYLWQNNDYVFLTALTGGTVYTFDVGGVSRFRVLGIETAAGIDPSSPIAFVTGLTFVGTGTVSMTQSPIVSQIPVPATVWMMLSGLCLIGLRRPMALTG